MRAREVVVVLGIVLAAWLAWSSWHGAADPAVDVDTGTASNTTVAAGTADATSGGGDHDAAALRRRVTGQAAARVDPGDVARLVQVRVLDAEGQPVAGLPVRYRRGPWDSHPLLLNDDTFGVVSRTGAVAVTDGDGIARWPWRELVEPVSGWSQWLVAAQRQAESGFVRWPMVERPHVVHELRLRVTRTLAVRVLNVDGAAAVSVPLKVEGWLLRASGTSTDLVPLSTAVTDGDGIARFVGVDFWTGALERRGATCPIRVSVDGPGLDVRVDLDATALPAAMPVLQLPGVGAIELVLQEAWGAPVVGDVVGLNGSDASVAVGMLETGGRARFPCVPLGRRWKAWSVLTFASTEFDGPKANGEVVTEVVRLEPARVVSGRVVLGDVAMPGLQIAVEVGGATGSELTDADGRFSLAARPKARAPTTLPLPDRLEEIVIAAQTEDGRRLEGRWRGMLEWSEGERDLGTIALVPVAQPVADPRPLVCAGIVLVDGDEGFGSLRLKANGGAADDVALDLDRATGEFAFHGNTASRVIVAGPLLSSVEVPFEPGQTDVVVDLRRRGRLAATFRGLDPTLLPWLEIRLVSGVREEPDEPEDEVEARPDRREQGRDVETFVWLAPSPGRHRLQVRCLGRAEPVLVVPDLVVDGAGQCSDARLAAIELPELQLAYVDMLDPRSVDVRVRLLRDGEWQADCPRARDGRFAYVRGAPVDLEVTAHGRRTLRLAGVNGDRSVTLEPGIRVTLRIDRARSVPFDRASITLDPQRSGDWETDGGVFAAGATEIVVLVREPGEFHTSALLDSRHDQQWRVEPETITVPAAGGAFDLRIPAEDGK